MSETFDCWAVMELMGHRRLAGKVTEVTVADHGMLKVEIPDGNPPVQYYSPSAVYAITPTTEETVADVNRSLLQPQPVQVWEIAPQDGAPFDAWADPRDQAGGPPPL